MKIKSSQLADVLADVLIYNSQPVQKVTLLTNYKEARHIV